MGNFGIVLLTVLSKWETVGICWTIINHSPLMLRYILNTLVKKPGFVLGPSEFCWPNMVVFHFFLWLDSTKPRGVFWWHMTDFKARSDWRRDEKTM